MKIVGKASFSLYLNVTTQWVLNTYLNLFTTCLLNYDHDHLSSSQEVSVVCHANETFSFFQSCFDENNCTRMRTMRHATMGFNSLQRYILIFLYLYCVWPITIILRNKYLLRLIFNNLDVYLEKINFNELRWVNFRLSKYFLFRWCGFWRQKKVNL